MADFVQIAYNADAVPLRVEFDWSELPATVEVDIASKAGTSLVAAGAGSLFTADTLNGALAVGATTLVLTTGGAGVVTPGDRFRIATSVAGRSEVVQAKFYDNSTKTVTLTRALIDAHSTGTAIAGLFATYSLDTTTVATWTQGLDVSIRWSPLDSGDNLCGDAITQLGQVLKSAFSGAGIRQDFADVYPSLYTIIEERWDKLYNAALRRTRAYFNARKRDIDKLVDQSVLWPVLTSEIYLMGCPVADEWEYERGVMTQTRKLELAAVENAPIWFDDDQDQTVDDGEEAPMSWWPSGRGL
ncbi:MAG: hypothetical protein GY832_23720 [Chloroflexi bacterium]|nr:hypothetical protein [Chloroflexota bacterium]